MRRAVPRIFEHVLRLLTIRIELCALVFGGVLTGARAHAQGLALPPIQQAPDTSPTTAAEQAYGVQLFTFRTQNEISPDIPRFPGDSIRTVITQWAERAIHRVPLDRVRGIQWDALGVLFLSAQRYDDAIASFDTRLRTSGRDLRNRAITLYTAITALAETDHVDQLRRAEQYLRQLDSIGVSAVLFRYAARAALVRTYYRMGRSSDVVTHAKQAIHLVPDIAYPMRYVAFTPQLILPLADVLSGQTNGKLQLDSLTRLLRESTSLPPELARDSMRIAQARWNVKNLNDALAASALIGTSAPPLLAHAWVNTADSVYQETPRAHPLADGKIRIIEFGVYTCGICKQAFPTLRRLQAMFPTQVEVIYATETLGWWQTELVDPSTEVAALSTYYQTGHGLTFPLAIWAGEKERLPDGSVMPRKSPAFDRYQVTATPVFAIVDGHGIIRRIMNGFDGGARGEQALIDVVTFLTREQRVTPPTS